MVKDSVKFLVDTMLKDDPTSTTPTSSKRYNASGDALCDDSLGRGTVQLGRKDFDYDKNCFMCWIFNIKDFIKLKFFIFLRFFLSKA